MDIAILAVVSGKLFVYFKDLGELERNQIITRIVYPVVQLKINRYQAVPIVEIICGWGE